VFAGATRRPLAPIPAAPPSVDPRLDLVELREVPLAFLDVETTGLDPWSGDRVCEIAIVRVVGGREESRLSRLVNPGRRVSPAALAVNGLDERELARSPEFRRVAGEVSAHLAGAVVVAHNAPFDAGFLAREYQLAGLAVPENDLLDTLLLARRNFHYRSNRLGALADTLGIRTPEHRALADALTTSELFARFVEQLFTIGPSLGDVVRAQGGPIPWPGNR
jgi:DNA polymerase-3 subunit epsilon